MPKQPVDEETDTVVERPHPTFTGEMVTVEVTKFGEGKVSTGEHIAGQGDIYATKGMKLSVNVEAAQALEAKGLVEIV